MKAIRLLTFRWIWRQPLRSAIVVLSVAAGVALTSSVVVVQTSLRRSFEDFSRSLAGPAPLRVIGPASRGGLADDVLGPVRRVDGVRAAIPVVQAVTLANRTPDSPDIPILALGLDCNIEALVGDFGCRPEQLALLSPSAPPLISPRLLREIGRDGFVRSDRGPRSILASRVVPELDEINNGHVVAYPLSTAQELYARPDSLDVIYVLPERGTAVEALKARVADAAGSHNMVLASTDPPGTFSTFGALLLAFLGLIGLFALVIAGVLIRNTLALSLQERRRDIAVVAALGAGRGPLLGGVLAESALLGVLGGLAGGVLGIPLASPILSGIEGILARTTGLELRVHPTWTGVVIGAVLGAATAVLASVNPARAAARVDIVGELYKRDRSPSVTHPHQFRSILLPVAVTGAGLLGAWVLRRSGGLEPWHPVAGQLTLIATVVLFFWTTARIAPWLLQSARPLLARVGITGRLAWANLVREPKRSAVMVIAATAAIGLGFGLSSITKMISEGIAADVQRGIRGRLLLTTMPSSNTLNLDARPSPELITKLREFPGVAGVRRGFGMGVLSPTEFNGIEASDDESFAYPILLGRFDAERFRKGEVWVGAGLARTARLRPGSTFTIPARDGFAKLRVQGVWANGDYNGREISTTIEQFERLYGPQAPVSLAVDPEPGVPAERLAADIRAADLDPFLNVLTPADQFEDTAREAATFVQPFWFLQRGIMFVAFAAVLFTLLLVAVQRRRELGIIAAVGLTPGGLALTVLVEALAVVGAATLIATLMGMALTELFREISFLVVPFTFPFTLELGAPFLYAGLTAAMLLIAAAWPAWRTSRLEVIDAIRYE